MALDAEMAAVRKVVDDFTEELRCPWDDPKWRQSVDDPCPVCGAKGGINDDQSMCID